MKEIRVRAWDKKAKRWLSGDEFATRLNFYDRTTAAVLLPYPRTEIDNIEVILSTGMQDDNGVDIYEGSIVKFRCHPTTLSSIKIGKVSYSAEFGKYWVKWFDNDLERERNYPSTTGINLRSIEVIGNIYENPELLEGLAKWRMKSSKKR